MPYLTVNEVVYRVYCKHDIFMLLLVRIVYAVYREERIRLSFIERWSFVRTWCWNKRVYSRYGRIYICM